MTQNISGKKKKKKSLYRTRELHIMLLPAVLFITVFAYMPIFGLVMAFQDFKPLLGFGGSDFVGLEQFRYIFTMPSFRNAFVNTMIISFFKIILSILVPLILSLMLNEVTKSWFKRSVQTIVFIPYFFSWAILAGMILEIFAYDGIINNVISQIFGAEPVAFLVSNKYFRSIIIGSDVWKGMGYNTVLLLAAITNVDTTLYEAAQVDGAGRWKQVLHVTLPSILPMVAVLTVLGLGNILNAGFEQILIMYNPTVEKTVDILDTLVYRLGMTSHQYSAAAAMGLFKSIISLIFVGASYLILYKKSDYRVF
ncbi:MAG TPA: ABC transporter permease subunit [Candidatus Eisenbergiella merdavium]|uniref:ABC transporter permease subunit n=1 Tax=Candidatus Eisenbergiella merdavium TaxID=2838551 RepID=A0A9D2SQW0_9FIRM|nr:ABC transporter permease subunit [Candidatus Eisenbergiella merdavium]